MKQQLLIFPFNGNGLEAIDCIDSNLFDFIGFVDDTPEKQGKHKNGFTVYDRKAFTQFPEAKVLAVPGSPASYKIRNEIIDSLQIPQDRFTSVISPKASIGKFVQIGTNCLIMPGVVLTSNAVIGNHVCILPNTVVHHDSKIGDYSLIGSTIAIAGGTHIGKNCYIGSGSKIINGISIGDFTLVGLGSTVIKSLDSHSKAVGNPARILK